MIQRQTTLLGDIRPRRALRLAAAGLFLLALVWQHVQATRLGYRVERARQRILSLRCANGALRMELETLLSPANLSAQARGRLGMSLVAPDALRNLDASALGPCPYGRWGQGPCDTAFSLAHGLLQRLLTRTRRILVGAVPT